MSKKRYKQVSCNISMCSLLFYAQKTSKILLTHCDRIFCLKFFKGPCCWISPNEDLFCVLNTYKEMVLAVC